jgi:very-short-patch-repair endonuclease/predicted transcriptional regulator of viral defense system
MDNGHRHSPFNEANARAIARGQHGLITRAQALEVGISISAIRRRTSAGLWERLLPGVYRIAGVPASGRQAVVASVLWAGAGALVSHRAAAALWEMPGSWGIEVELTVPYTRAPKSPRVTVHRSLRLDRADRTKLDGIPITTPTRTLIDVAASIADEALEAAVEDALHRGLTTSRRLRARLDSLGGKGRAGSEALGALLQQRGRVAALESVLEVKVWRLLTRSGLELPARQHWVRACGRRYRIDFAWPGRKLALEADGWSTHGTVGSFRADRSRSADLASCGWRVIPATWEDVERHPDVLLERIGRALAPRAGSVEGKAPLTA